MTAPFKAEIDPGISLVAEGTRIAGEMVKIKTYDLVV